MSGAACTCGCCRGLGPETPAAVSNLPGLPAVAYRVGTYGDFRATMLAALSSAQRPALRDLATREDDDFSIALVDAWAMVGDVLTFYGERAANEAYLRTATERISLLQLARLIGYELRPGVAAGAVLVFELETAAGAPEQVTVPAGTAVLSIPGPGQTPQTFETTDELVARPEWNALRPLLLQPQTAGPDAVTLAGVGLHLAQGDELLLDLGSAGREVRTALRVAEDTTAVTTRVDFQLPDPPPPSFDPPAPPTATTIPAGTRLTEDAARTWILGRTWAASDLLTQATTLGWSVDELTDVMSRELAETAGAGSVYALRTRAAVFGHNAPDWSSLPGSLRYGEQIKDSTGTTRNVAAAYPTDWEGRTLYDDSDFSTHHTTGGHKEETAHHSSLRHVYLDTTYPKIVAGSLVALESTDAGPYTYEVEANSEISRSAYTISAKVSRLTLDSSAGFDELEIRETAVRCVSELLALASVPIPDTIAGTRVMLDGFYAGLVAPRTVIVQGEPADQPGVVAREVAAVEDVTIEGGYTVLTLANPGLGHVYVRTSVTINANAAAATNGESKQEVLGSGDASQAYQAFPLRQPPLTYVGAATASGTESTLRVYVGGVRWHEVPTLYGLGPTDRSYITRLDDKGGTTVEFGDGRTGARLPTGSENVEARYRKGIGLAGQVGAGQLSLLLNRPLGVKSVSNPLPASGAQDAERESETRTNAPLTVLTLDRVVSLDDYEDFARAFAGVEKALATPILDRAGEWVLLTVAGPAGAVIDPAGDVGDHLTKAIRAQGDVEARFALFAYRPALFEVSARLSIDPDHLTDRVLAAAEQALRDRFSFDSRSFGGAVAQSDVEAVLQGVDGVIGLELLKLARSDRPPGGPDVVPRLWASVPRIGDSPLLGAELLMLDPRPVDLQALA